MNREEALNNLLNAYSEYYDLVPFKHGLRRQELKEAYALLCNERRE